MLISVEGKINVAMMQFDAWQAFDHLHFFKILRVVENSP